MACTAGPFFVSQQQAEIEAIEAEYAAKIAAARIASEERRDAVLVGVPFTICGVTVRLMTLADYLTLSVLGNAHVARIPVPQDKVEAARFWHTHDAMLLWFLSPQWSAAESAREEFFKRAALFDPDERVRGVLEYMHAVFADAPRGPSPEVDEPPPADPVGVSFAIHWIGVLARRFPWSRAEIRALPLPELFQYLRLIDAERRIELGRPLVHLDVDVSRLWAEKLQRIEARLASRS